MKITSGGLVGSLASVAFFLSSPTAMAAATEARVTQVIREVKLLPSKADERPATVNDKVSEDTGVKTGGGSRSELTFADMTITRLGSNTIFSFTRAGHTAKVDSGSILLRVPKDSGGGTIKNNAVTVAITGTTVIFEGSRGTKSKLITLEGRARVSLTSKPGDPRNVLAGQMLDVPAGATTLPDPVNIDLNDVMRNHPLITDFKPLPSRPLILAAAQQQAPAPPPPRTSGPRISIDVFGGGLNTGPRRPPSRPPGRNQPPADDSTTQPPTTNRSPGATKPPPAPSPRYQRTPRPKSTPPPGPR
jgi:hypothetical protein